MKSFMTKCLLLFFCVAYSTSQDGSHGGALPDVDGHVGLREDDRRGGDGSLPLHRHQGEHRGQGIEVETIEKLNKVDMMKLT